MSTNILENDYVDFRLREMESGVNMIKNNLETIFKILDEYEKVVETKFGA